jgi:putative membrane protein
MGAADAVPGVSGGTVALILGIYDRFIGALHTVIRSFALVRTTEGRKALTSALRFLIPLALGIAASYFVATRILVGPSKNPDGWLRRVETAPLCYAFFFGLVIASVYEPFRRIKTHGGKTWTALLLGAAFAFVFTGLPYIKAEPETWMLLPGGAMAISVMLLPGISGSLLLLILNQYRAVANSVHDGNVVRLLVFGSGLILGIGLFVPVLRWLLRLFHDNTMAFLTGLMIGSLRALWPWKSQYDPKFGFMENVAPFGSLPMTLLLAACGFVVIVAMGMIERRLKK